MAGVLRYLPCHANPPECVDHSLGVVVLVGTQGFLVGTGTISRHHLCGIPLPGAHCLCHPAIDDQGMAGVHEHVPPVAAGECRVGVGLTGYQRVGIDSGAMGLVAELDAVEIDFRQPLA